MREKLSNFITYTKHVAVGNHWNDHIPQKTAFSVIALAIIAVSIPVTVYTAQKKQDNRQEAAKKTAEITQERVICTPVAPIPVTKSVAEATQNQAQITALQTEQADEALLTDAEAYVQSSSKEKTSRRSRLQSNAQKRKELLVKTMRENPEAAFDLVQYDDDEDLNAATKDCTAIETTIEGELEVMITDFRPTGNEYVSSNQYYVQNNAGQQIEIYPAQDFDDDMVSGTRIKVSGYKIDNNMVFDPADPEAFQITASPSRMKKQGTTGLIPKAYAAVPGSVGDQKTLVMLFQAAGQATISDSVVTDIKANFFKDINEYYSVNSYGRTTFSGDIYGPFTMPAPSRSDACETGNDAYRYQVMQKANEQGVDFSKYKRLVYISPFKDCQPFLGRAGYGLNTINTPDGNIQGSTALITDTLTLSTAQHELGHNLGVNHATFYSCGTVTLTKDGSCPITGLGNTSE